MELIKYASERSVYVFCDTNGIKITKDYAQQLKDSGLEMLYVSIDSPDPQKHDEYRVMKGCFDKAVEAVKMTSPKKVIPTHYNCGALLSRKLNQ